MLHPVHHQQHHPPQHFLRDANANSLPRKERHDVRNDFPPQKHRGKIILSFIENSCFDELDHHTIVRIIIN
jgi:hypothetical protein